MLVAMLWDCEQLGMTITPQFHNSIVTSSKITKAISIHGIKIRLRTVASNTQRRKNTHSKAIRAIC